MSTTWTVASGGNLQAAIDSAALGDTILVEAGATFTGPFTLPAKSGTGTLTIRSSAPESSLPASGVRVSPSYAPVMPKLVSAGLNQSVLTVAPSAHHYALLGLEICPANDAAVVTELVQLGDGGSAQNSLAMVPHDLIVDRCFIHGSPGNGSVKRGICLHCANGQILGNWISDIHIVGADAQAIAGWNGPGPFLIDNNELQASGENVMFGGADPWIANLVPSDITFTNNHVFKPLSWRVGDPSYAGTHWTIKNLFEIKNAQRVKIDGNLFENCWADAQAGYAINLKASNQTGVATWSTCQNVTFTNNIIRHCGSGIGIGRDPYSVVPPNHITIVNNLWIDISGTNWGGDGNFLLIADANNVTVDHNTVFNSGLIIGADAGYAGTMINFTFTNNIVAHNAYGVWGPGQSSGTATLAHFWGATWKFLANVIEAIAASGVAQTAYPTGNFFPADWASVGFTDYAGGDYSLSISSPYHNAATDGTDLGYVASAAVAQPAPAPTPATAPTPTKKHGKR